MIREEKIKQARFVDRKIKAIRNTMIKHPEKRDQWALVLESLDEELDALELNEDELDYYMNHIV